MKLVINFWLPFLFGLFFSISLSSQSSFQIVLQTDFEGRVVKGSKEELIKKIRQGQAVRVGYQLDFDDDKVADFDHWTDAEFITILKGDVFTQIRNINLQIPKLNIPQVDIIPINTMWTAILGTNGLLVNRFIYSELKYDIDEDGNPIVDARVEKELEKREPRTYKVATFWSVGG